jgi:beta-galactosidase
MKSPLASSNQFSRRGFIKTCSLGTAALASGSVLGFFGGATARAASAAGAARYLFSLDQDWLFGGRWNGDSNFLQPGYDESNFAPVTLPHCVAKLSWQGWTTDDWAGLWVYRRHFAAREEFKNRRIFLDFDGVMTRAVPVFNGQALPDHIGGYLPFHYEITNLVKKKNVLGVAIDSRWLSVPPEGYEKGPNQIDFLEPGGIVRSVRLRAVPQIFIADVYAKPVKVTDADRRVEVSCTIDAAVIPQKSLRLQVELLDGDRSVAADSKTLDISQPGQLQANLVLSDLGNVKLWDTETPQLYNVVATLFVDDEPLHDYCARIGLRDARFELDGFFLNGRRLQIFGLCRQELLPYTGFAMPPRVMRRDAEILKRDFNCNAVRCSHYPQSPGFLDACDELGLMVWEELPGWHYIGNRAWQDLAVRDVQDMVRRDRNRPSVIIWGVRINESANVPEFYKRTTAAAKELDDTRPASGAMDSYGLKHWSEDVYAFNDYHQDEKTGAFKLREPLPGVPFLLTETVGQLVGPGPSIAHKYRRDGDVALQMKQAIYHAQAHDQAAANPRFSGVIAWCAFDYGSGENPYNQIKCPGVADIFRIPKLGATFYQAQISPEARPVIEPNFYWDFGPQTPKGPGKNVAIFSNCDRLEIFVGDQKVNSVTPDRTNFSHLKYPPFFCDLEVSLPEESDRKKTPPPELRIDGYVGENLALSRSFSGDLSMDKFKLVADDKTLIADGADATRVVFRVLDQYGAQRPFANGTVMFHLAGPGIIVGDNPFTLLNDSGGVGAVWIKSQPNRTGTVVVRAEYSTWNGEAQTTGEGIVTIEVLPDNGLQVC